MSRRLILSIISLCLYSTNAVADGRNKPIHINSSAINNNSSSTTSNNGRWTLSSNSNGGSSAQSNNSNTGQCVRTATRTFQTCGRACRSTLKTTRSECSINPLCRTSCREAFESCLLPFETALDNCSGNCDFPTEAAKQTCSAQIGCTNGCYRNAAFLACIRPALTTEFNCKKDCLDRQNLDRTSQIGIGQCSTVFNECKRGCRDTSQLTPTPATTTTPSTTAIPTTTATVNATPTTTPTVMASVTVTASPTTMGTPNF